jgi:hypothetical protein
VRIESEDPPESAALIGRAKEIIQKLGDNDA